MNFFFGGVTDDELFISDCTPFIEVNRVLLKICYYAARLSISF